MIGQAWKDLLREGTVYKDVCPRFDKHMLNPRLGLHNHSLYTVRSSPCSRISSSDADHVFTMPVFSTSNK